MTEGGLHTCVHTYALRRSGTAVQHRAVPGVEPTHLPRAEACCGVDRVGFGSGGRTPTSGTPMPPECQPETWRVPIPIHPLARGCQAVGGRTRAHAWGPVVATTSARRNSHQCAHETNSWLRRPPTSGAPGRFSRLRGFRSPQLRHQPRGSDGHRWFATPPSAAYAKSRRSKTPLGCEMPGGCPGGGERVARTGRRASTHRVYSGVECQPTAAVLPPPKGGRLPA